DGAHRQLGMARRRHLADTQHVERQIEQPRGLRGHLDSAARQPDDGHVRLLAQLRHRRCERRSCLGAVVEHPAIMPKPGAPVKVSKRRFGRYECVAILPAWRSRGITPLTSPALYREVQPNRSAIASLVEASI